MSEEKTDWGHWTKHPEVKPEGAFGFVYRIVEKSTSKYYIGCKQLVKKLTRPPLKGKKRKRRSLVESDWKTYCSSSGAISESVEKNEDSYAFEILSFHNSKSEMKIEETRCIIEHIFDENCFNEVVGIRCRVTQAMKKNINKEKEV